jgi:cytochrome c oxidase subunit IV
MSGKTLIWGGMFVGSTVGGLVPYLWNGGFMAYFLWSVIGGLLGIWGGFKLAKSTGAL